MNDGDLLQWGAGLAQWWEHLPSISVARDQFSDPIPYMYVGWVCWFSTLLWEVFLWVLRFSPLIKNVSRKNGLQGLSLKFKDFSRLCEPQELILKSLLYLLAHWASKLGLRLPLKQVHYHWIIPALVSPPCFISYLSIRFACSFHLINIWLLLDSV